MATENVEIQGLDELERALLELEAKTAFKTLRGALAKGARPMIKEAKALAPKDTGALAQSIGMFSRKGRAGDRAAVVFVGPKSKSKTAIELANSKRAKPVKGVFYGHMVEKGTVKMQPQPFLRPAFDAMAGRAIGIFANDLKKKVTDGR